MAIIDKHDFSLFFTIRKKFKRSQHIDPLKPNAGVNAFPWLVDGVYKSWRRYGKETNWRCKLYTPTNNQLPNQQAHRAIYGAGVGAWRSLTFAQKQVYNEKAYGKHMSGYNVFMKEYLLTH